MEVDMGSITIALPEDSIVKLKEVAGSFGLTSEELVRASIENLLASPDEAFEKAAEYVLNKNRELYRRLA
jgi:hypothetical protein